MGIIRRVERKKNYQRIEIEELRRISLSCAGGIIHRKRYEEENNNIRVIGEESVDPLDKLVCVTSGTSYLGIAIVNQLVIRGYSVRVMIDSQEDAEKVREMQMSGEMRGNNNAVEAVIANSAEIVSLTEAFNGCRDVFHTGAFIDPSGVSGYSKSKVELEVETTRKIIEACAATGSVRSCVLTSSLLACIWNDTSLHLDAAPSIIDHTCWSGESVCMIKKLWYALGKLKAEKAAMEAAKVTDLKLATICTALIIGPESCSRNSTPTIAYLKGGREMYTNGLLAVVDVDNAAKAHVSVLEEMKQKAARGRYLCFDNVIQSQEDVENLSQKTGIDFSILDDVPVNFPPRFVLSNLKQSMLTSRQLRCNNK